MNFKTATSHNGMRSASAYTLIEVIVSAGLVGIMVSALYAAFILGFASIKTTREDLRGTQLLQQKMEAIRLCTWTQLSNCPTSFTDYYDPTGVSSNKGGTIYVGTVSTTGAATNISSSASYKSRVHLINVTVIWTNYVGKTPVAHARQMQSLSAYDGMQNYIYGYTN